jgi:hypothetical protein
MRKTMMGRIDGLNQAGQRAILDDELAMHLMLVNGRDTVFSRDDVWIPENERSLTKGEQEQLKSEAKKMTDELLDWVGNEGFDVHRNHEVFRLRFARLHGEIQKKIRTRDGESKKTVLNEMHKLMDDFKSDLINIKSEFF